MATATRFFDCSASFLAKSMWYLAGPPLETSPCMTATRTGDDSSPGDGNARTTRHSFAPVIRAGSSGLSQGLAETANGHKQTKAAAATGRQCRSAAAAALL